MDRKIIEVNGRRLKLVENIIFNGGAIFKKHHRAKVIDDRSTLLKLFQDGQIEALEFYEKFYVEMLYSNNYESQFDLLNYPEKADGMDDKSIYEMCYLIRERNSSIKKAAWARKRKKKKS